MKEILEHIGVVIVGLFFGFSWGYYAIKLNELENEIKKLKKKINEIS